MFFVFVTSDPVAPGVLEDTLCRIDDKGMLFAVANGFELIHFLQEVKKGESYPDLIIMADRLARLSAREVLELLKTDDIYRLIPVIIILQRENVQDEAVFTRLGTETILQPEGQEEWLAAARKMYAACN